MTLERVLAIVSLIVAVTVAVTIPRAHSEVIASVPTITNLDTGHKYPFSRTYPSADACSDAVGNLDEFFTALRDPDTNTKVPDYKGSDDDLGQATMGLALQILMNTGKLPNFTISCESAGDPA